MTSSSTAGASTPSRRGVPSLIDRLDDGKLMRTVFVAMLVGAVAVVGYDVRALYDAQAAAEPAAAVEVGEPVLPPAVETAGGGAASSDPRRHLRTEPDLLKSPISFELASAGVLKARGSIDVGAAARFAAEIEARGEYVRTVSLDSPGGSLEDAMEMARLIRENRLATEVPEGALCASSCPLVLAGGTTRRVADEAAVGLHQFYSGAQGATAPAQIMSDTQVTAARISRYLSEMDVDPAIWLHALDTPPRALYYLSPEEMERYRLVTGIGPLAQR